MCLDPRLPDDPSAVWLHLTNASAILERSSHPKFPNESLLAGWQRRLRQHLAGDARMGQKWATCAVVGSSGALLHHEHGKEIDSAAAVFRINAAPTRGFQTHVGSRTSIRIWGARRWPEELNEWREDRAPVAMYCQPTRWIGRCWDAIAAEPHLGQLARPRLSPLLWEEALASIRRAGSKAGVGWRASSFPSTGAITLWIALRLCVHVRLYGFGDGSHPWNCAARAGQPTCGRYFRDYLHNTTVASLPHIGCGRWWGYGAYVEEGARFHDLRAEWAWIAALHREGRIHQPRLCGSTLR